MTEQAKELPAEITPTEEQEEALEELYRWLHDIEGDYKTLSGYAGTGKTTILQFVVDKAKEMNLNTLVTATTNKAVKVLAEKITGAKLSTIQSALNIVPKLIEDVEVFTPNKYGSQDIYGYDLIIIDECSMISSVDKTVKGKLVKSLLTLIKEEIPIGTKVLFCGDPAQLQPVNEEGISKCFDFNPVTLTNIVRYGNVIAQKAKLVREIPNPVPYRDLLNGDEIRTISQTEVLEKFKNFRDNPDKVRFLCWTNKEVTKWNNILREADYGYRPKRMFEPGDIVVANKPAEVGSYIVMKNSEEGIVTHVDEKQNGLSLTIQSFEGRECRVNVLRPEYKVQFDRKLKELAQAKEWSQFWGLKKSAHDIRHCYAITVHKSQGSTFDEVVVHTDNLYANPRILERNQLIYVGMTRASERINFYVR